MRRRGIASEPAPAPRSGLRTRNTPIPGLSGWSPLIEFSTSPAAIASLKGDVQAVNEPLVALWGLSAEQLLATKAADLVPVPSAWQCLANGHVWRGTLLLPRGAEPTLLVLVPLRDESGVVSAAACFFHHAESPEASGRLLFDAAPVMMHSIDEQGAICDVNQRWLDATGYRRDEVLGRHATDFMTEESAQRARDEVIPRFWRDGEVKDVPYRFVKKDGSVIDVLLDCVAVTTHEGRPMSSSVVRDVTAQRRSEVERERLTAQLDQMRRIESLGRLTSGIAHDFNNMLGVIMNYAELALRRSETGDATYEPIRQIRDAAQRSVGLTRQLLLLGRRDALGSERMDINARLHELSGHIQNVLGPNIQLQLQLASDTWPVRLAPPQLEQILVNLAANARDAMPQGGRLSVRSENVLIESADPTKPVGVNAGRYVRLSIEDTGAGIAAELADQVFEPFFTTKEPDSGTGLGLSIILGIIQHAGGQIELSSEPGQGTTVSILLPADVGTVATQPSGSLGTILVVDDEAALRRSVARMLSEGGYRVIQARSGEEALQLFSDEVDAVVSDIMMPGMSGTELVVALDQRRPDLPVLFMSAYPFKLMIEGGLDPDRAPCLEKPFGAKTLLARLGELLERRASAKV